MFASLEKNLYLHKKEQRVEKNWRMSRRKNRDVYWIFELGEMEDAVVLRKRLQKAKGTILANPNKKT